MGYSTDSRGRLCCDRCDSSEHKARRRPCPVGYCPATILCAVCWSDPAVRAEWAAYHVAAGCREASARYHAELAERDRIIAAGGFVWCSGLTVAPGVVHVLFRGADGACIGRYVSSSSYALARSGVHFTPADFDSIAGWTLPEAPGEFENGSQTKVTIQAVDLAAILDCANMAPRVQP